jgi:hypothetical protein
MNIRQLVLVGILIIVGGIGAYIFLYPQEEKVKQAVVVPKAPLPIAAPVAPRPASAPVSAPVAASSLIAVPVASSPAVTPVVATTDKTLQPPLQLSKSFKTGKAKPERSKTADLRHCLQLETNAEIAKCAGE